MSLQIKRIYDPADDNDGSRFLVDRLWPRGVSKEKADLTAWLRDIAPSDALRRQFHGATAGSASAWQAFIDAYHADLNSGSAAISADVAAIRDALNKGRVTLLYAAKDHDHNNAVALQMWLAAQGID